MKRLLTVFLVTLLCVGGYAQNRNMLPNSDFEQNLDDYWYNDFKTELSVIDDGIRGKSLKITNTDGMEEFKNRIINKKVFPANNGDQFKVTFKAKATGANAPTVYPEFNMLWDSEYQSLFAAGSNAITIDTDGAVKSYTLTSAKVGVQNGAESFPQTDFMDFLLYFAVPDGSELIIDDVELVRVNEEWNAAINMNGNFAILGSNENDGYAINERIMEFLLYSRDVTGSLNSGYSAGKNTAVVTIGSNTDDVNIFSGMTYFHDVNRTNGKKYRIRFDAEISGDITSFTPSINGTVEWAGAPGAVTSGDLGNLPAVLGGVQTYTSDIWTTNAVPEGGLWLYIDVRIFGSGTVTFHNLYLEEVIDLTSLVIDMPNKVLISSTEPVGIWANPTNADNAVTLVVDNGLGEVTQDADGTWSYKALAEGPVKITATSKVDGSKTAEFTVANVTDLSTGIAEKQSDNLNIYYNDGQICIAGLEGNETIELFNLYGQLLLSLPAQQSVDVGSLEKGLYILQITKAGTSKTQKIIIQ